MMGNLLEPFISAQRFRPTFHNQRGTSFVFGLTINSQWVYIIPISLLTIEAIGDLKPSLIMVLLLTNIKILCGSYLRIVKNLG